MKRIQTYTRAVLLCLVASTSVLAEMGPPISDHKKVIGFAGIVMTPAYLRAHIADIERIPFDGLVFTVYGNDWKYFINRDGHPGLPRRELQAAGGAENGIVTDASGEHPDVVRRLSRFLRRWEKDNPRVPPTLRGEDLPAEVVDQLRSLGYTH